MSNEIKVGDWAITEAGRLRLVVLHSAGCVLRNAINVYASECAQILSVDRGIAKDIAEEIVLHGTPVDEVIAKLQRHLEGGR